MASRRGRKRHRRAVYRPGDLPRGEANPPEVSEQVAPAPFGSMVRATAVIASSGKTHDTGLFITIVGALLAPLLYVLQANGVVTIGWMLSAGIYITVIGFFTWAFLKWNVPLSWGKLRVLVLVAVDILLCLTSAYGVLMEHRKSVVVSVKEMSRFASGIVAAISSGETVNVPLGTPPNFDKSYLATGFFVRDDWRLATCVNAISGTHNPAVVVAGQQHGAFGAVTVGSQSILASIYGIVILKLDMPGSMDPKQTWIPALADRPPEVGERVFVYGAENGGLVPSFSTIEGQVVRIAVGSPVSPALIALSTIPFRPSFCGAPVLDERMHVVGMMTGANESGESEVVLSQHIIEELRRLSQ